MFNLVAESLLVACFFLLVSYKRYFEISPPLRIALLSASSHKIIQESWNLCQMILLITRGSYNCSLFRVDTFRFWNLFRRHHALVHHFLVFPSILYDFCICFFSNQGSLSATRFKPIWAISHFCCLFSTFELPYKSDEIDCVQNKIK